MLEYASMHNLPLTCRQLYLETDLEVYRWAIFDATDPFRFYDLINKRNDICKNIHLLNSISEINVSAAGLDRLFSAPIPRCTAADMFTKRGIVINLELYTSGSLVDHETTLRRACLRFDFNHAEIRFVKPGSSEVRSIFSDPSVWEDVGQYLD